MSWDFTLSVKTTVTIETLRSYSGWDAIDEIADWLGGLGHADLADTLRDYKAEIPTTRDASGQNYTFNVSKMFYACTPDGVGIRDGLHGLTGAAAVPFLTATIDEMWAREDEMREMEPENGWGSFDGALRLLLTLRQQSRENPDGVWGVH